MAVQEDILIRAMNGYMGCCDCDGNKAAFRECGMEISRLRHEATLLYAEIARLLEAIRRLANQDATLSVQDGNVTVTMDAALTDAERRALEVVIESESTPDVHYLTPAAPSVRDTLRGLLERIGGGACGE